MGIWVLFEYWFIGLFGIYLSFGFRHKFIYLFGVYLA